MVQHVHLISLVLAQTKGAFPTGPYIWIVITAIFVLTAGGMVVLHLRKKMLEDEASKNSAASLMETLRDLHRRGEISDEEYEQTRKSLATRVSHMLDTKRAGDLFELPDPKRRITGARAAERGPIAPAPPPSPRTPATDMPPGYGDEDKPGRDAARTGDRP